MASFSWDSPLYTHGTFSTTTALIQDFNDKLIQAGLIDYTSGNNASIAAATAPSATINYGALSPIICSLNFRLPVGNGVIQYDNALSTTDYKVISQASYDNTVVNLKFDFYYFNYSNGGQPWSSNAGIVLVCYCYISTGTSPIRHDYVTSFGLTNVSVNNSASLSFSHKIKNYISLTRNHLSIIWGSINKSNEANTGLDGHYSRKRHTVMFSLYRNNGNIQIMYPNSLSDTPTVSTASHYNNTGITTYTKNGMASYTNANDMAWKFNSPSTVNSNIIIQPTLINIPDHYANDPGVWCTRINDSQEVTSSSDFVVMYGGQPTKLNYMILSGQQPWFKPYKMTKDYSYAFLFDNYPCTTTLL